MVGFTDSQELQSVDAMEEAAIDAANECGDRGATIKYEGMTDSGGFQFSYDGTVIIGWLSAPWVCGHFTPQMFSIYYRG